MSAMYVSQLKEHDDSTKQQNEPMVLTTSDNASKRPQHRFPSVDSVICDIDAKWETRGLVA